MGTHDDWLEARVRTTDANVEQLEEWLFGAGALSVTAKDALVDDALEHAVLEPLPGELRLWNNVMLIGLFAQGSDERVTAEGLRQAAMQAGIPCPDFQLGRLLDQVWERSWMESFQPMRFGHRLWICPKAADAVEPDAINLRLDPGMAFGTGTHATTAQCLHWLGEQTADTLQPLAGKRVIDYGCGSGVLAIAALLLGAEHAWAVDIDEQALLATRENAAANNVLEKLSVAQPEALAGMLANTHAGTETDIVLANILFKPLIELADTLASRVVSGGSLVLSGILENQIEPLRMRYNPNFAFAPARTSEGWALMTATRR